VHLEDKQSYKQISPGTFACFVWVPIALADMNLPTVWTKRGAAWGR
jgi:hypothetical protein